MKIILTVSGIIIICLALSAFETGGNFEIESMGYIDNNNDFDHEILETADIEIFFPEIAGQEFRCQFEIFRPLQGLMHDKQTSIFFKKLYAGFDMDYFQLTLGRQPVSWAFGSMFNLIDYTPGSIALGEEFNSKYTDAAELYIPINWNSGIAFIASFPGGIVENMNALKWGIRVRAGIAGYDITASYVDESDSVFTVDSTFVLIANMLPDKRAAVSFKGDLWDLGIYGSSGYYFDSISNGFFSYTLGTDYSFFMNYTSKIVLQAEYTGIELTGIDSITRNTLLHMDRLDNRLDIISSSINYPIDEFSSISLFTIISMDDGSMTVSPIYSILLPLNIDMELSAYVFLGRDSTLFAPGPVMPRCIGNIRLKYQW